jgi:hypothetical protein
MRGPFQSAVTVSNILRITSSIWLGRIYCTLRSIAKLARREIYDGENLQVTAGEKPVAPVTLSRNRPRKLYASKWPNPVS